MGPSKSDLQRIDEALVGVDPRTVETTVTDRSTGPFSSGVSVIHRTAAPEASRVLVEELLRAVFGALPDGYPHSVKLTVFVNASEDDFGDIFAIRSVLISMGLADTSDGASSFIFWREDLEPFFGDA